MPRPVWSGAISFGLVTIPIKVLPATENHSLRFHQYHLEDMGRVRTRKICELEDREVSTAEIGKGYEVNKDTIVAIADHELDDMPLPTAKAIEIAAFVSYESIDPVRIGEGYYLQGDGQVAAKPYVLLRRALERGRVRPAGPGGQGEQPVVGGRFGVLGPFGQQRRVGQDTVAAAALGSGGGLGQTAGPDSGRPHPQCQKARAHRPA